MLDMKIEVDTTEAQAAIEIMERLTLAVDTAREALEKLNAQAHGGISIQIAGKLVNCTIMPQNEASAR